MVRVLVLIVAVLAATSASAQASKPVENRGNAAATGVPNLMLSATTAGQSDLCLGVQAVGFGSLALGLTIDFVKVDKSCRRIRLSRRLQELGHEKAAIEVLCFEPEVRKAMDAAQTPCEAER